MTFTWEDLDFWRSKEWEHVQQRLDDLDTRRVKYNPSRQYIFAALDETPFEETRVAIVGQDPYPDPLHATGVAFSIREDESITPATLKNIFKEYHNDLHYPDPTTGCLHKWTSQGVLLWNVYPTCQNWLSLSHAWLEWETLTKEIVTRLNSKGITFVLCGAVARRFAEYVNSDHKPELSFRKFVKSEFSSELIEVSHPAPRGAYSGFNPFIGSRIFSRINATLVDPIDWKLP